MHKSDNMEGVKLSALSTYITKANSKHVQLLNSRVVNDLSLPKERRDTFCGHQI
jgi:hypothetical protein